MNKAIEKPATVFDNLTLADVTERLEGVLPSIEAAAVQVEHDRKPADTVIEALEATGIFRSFVPKRYGGLEIGLDSFIDLGLAVSEQCTSTGWITTFYMEHNWILSQFSRETQDAIYGNQPYVLAPASISPNGRAKRVGNHYELNGRWAWGTGVMHADWVILNGIVQGDAPEPRLFVVPREHISVDDVWHTSGMRGTGSNDMLADQLLVDNLFSEPLKGMAVGRGSGVRDEDYTYRYPMMPLLAIAAAIPAVGGAKRALKLFQERVQKRTLYGSGASQKDQAGTHIRLGRVSAQIADLETRLRRAAADLEQWGERDATCPRTERARLRVVIAEIVGGARDAIMTVVEASGAGAHMSDSPLQRIQRDVNMLSCHTVFDLENAAENYGRILLDMEPASPV